MRGTYLLLTLLFSLNTGCGESEGDFNCALLGTCADGGTALCPSGGSERGGPCSQADPCCAPGLSCVEVFGQGATCLAPCDTTAAEPTCTTTEICLPFNDAGGQGVCAEGQCTPGAEVETCGEPSTCIDAEPASFCFPPGERNVGEPCLEIFDAPEVSCQAGLACVYGRCAPACEDGACDAGRCVDRTVRHGGRPFTFCHEDCDIFAQTGCAASEACALTDADDGLPLSLCLNTDASIQAAGAPCEPNGYGYWGSCSPSMLCTTIQSSAESTCHPLCDAEHLGGCSGPTVCVNGAFSDVDIGLCAGTCDPVGLDPRCPDGEACSLAFSGFNAAGDRAGTGLCEPSRGIARTGESCPTGDECEGGHLCARLLSSEPATCLKLCAPGAVGERGCAGAEQCRLGLFERIDTIGVCLRPDL